MKHIAKAAHVKKADMADKALVARTTGYVLDGVSPLGQKKLLKTVIDESALLSKACEKQAFLCAKYAQNLTASLTHTLPTVRLLIHTDI